MAKVFTITSGLENLGALKSGGQGSVYKGRRKGEIFTAIKILPTPIANESDEDKNFISFKNEVQKLRKVNESPNPNVVRFIDSGLTDSGNFPYIEMEYIEGPDLAELLQSPHDPVFTIKETIRVADHLSNALAHCHRADVKHGDIKSNNVKFNRQTGNYLLLDFGLSVMSDEQRRTSMRHAGAIEFMAPEQSMGQTLFETDIYSFGIILYELLAGSVPFPLKSSGEMARNAVMVAHMESTPPEIISQRLQNLPKQWSVNKRKAELHVPVWLLTMIEKCIDKNPERRFRNGAELQEHLHYCIAAHETSETAISEPAVPSHPDLEMQWRKRISQLEERDAAKEKLIAELQDKVSGQDRELYQYRYATDNAYPKPPGVSKSLFVFVLFIAMGLAGYNGYQIYIEQSDNVKTDTSSNVRSRISEGIDSLLSKKSKSTKKAQPRSRKLSSQARNKISDPSGKSGMYGQPVRPAGNGEKYLVVNTAYLYDEPDENSIRDEYVSGDSDIFTAIEEKNNFIFVRFINSEGTDTRAWLLKNELNRVYE